MRIGGEGGFQGCLSSVSVEMLNGKPQNWFTALTGLKQRYPLSPFFFTLVVDVESRILNRATGRGIMKSIKVGRVLRFHIYNLLTT